MRIHKRDVVAMDNRAVAAGREMWRRTSQKGRLVSSSFNAEENAPKTWILYANPLGEEISTIECELYQVGRHSDPNEALVMLVGMCPKCGNNFSAREDNKTMHIERVSYRKAPKFLKVNYRYHMERERGRRISDDDMVPVVSSPERWACDYCKEWCVKVYDGIAKDDHRGVRQVTVHGNVPILGEKESVNL